MYKGKNEKDWGRNQKKMSRDHSNYNQMAYKGQ